MTALPAADALIAALAAKMRVAIDPARCALVGIHSGGAWIAERLHRELGIAAPLGTIDVGLHRDDLETSGLRSAMRASSVPFEVGGADIVLVDDVLYTGRTIRAAMNELFDYGRPDRIRLAALIDRGGRHLPIAADFTAAVIELPDDREIVLARAADSTLSLRSAVRSQPGSGA